jgi:hypothetical protein
VFTQGVSSFRFLRVLAQRLRRESNPPQAVDSRSGSPDSYVAKLTARDGARATRPPSCKSPPRASVEVISDQTHLGQGVERCFFPGPRSSLSGRVRTYDLLLPKQARFHLCHTQKWASHFSKLTLSLAYDPCLTADRLSRFNGHFARLSSGDRICTCDLLVMSQASYCCSTPRRLSSKA